MKLKFVSLLHSKPEDVLLFQFVYIPRIIWKHTENKIVRRYIHGIRYAALFFFSSGAEFFGKISRKIAVTTNNIRLGYEVLFLVLKDRTIFIRIPGLYSFCRDIFFENS